MANLLLSRISLFTALFLLLSLIIPSVIAAAPVWTAIADREIGAGNTLTFTVSASDADGDIITLDIASEQITGVTLTGNSTGAGTFTWITNSSHIGVHDFIFRASTGEGESRETALETARITVTASATTPSLSSEEQEYNRLVNRLNSLEDDFYADKKKYQRAIDDDNQRDIDRYDNKLNDLDDDLSNLRDDADNLIDDVDRGNLDNRRSLLDDLDNLQEDITKLRDRIDTLLNDRNHDGAGTVISTYTPPAPRIEPQPERTKVVIGTLDFPGGNVPNTVEQPIDKGGETLQMVLIGAGIVVALAVLVFLVALMV